MPFSRRRLRRDLVSALPAIGMILGAVAGAGLGLLNPTRPRSASPAMGIGAGLVLGLFLRVVFRRE